MGRDRPRRSRFHRSASRNSTPSSAAVSPTPLTLTEKGQETGRAIAGKIDRLVEAASEGLTPEQRQVMYDALTCISGHLERLAAPRKSQNGETDL